MGTRNIVGKLVLPDANGETGTITFELNQAGHYDDGGTEQTIGGRIAATILATGELKDQAGTGTLALVANDTITPAGSKWIAEIRIGDWRERQLWTVPDGVGDLDVGDVTIG